MSILKKSFDEYDKMKKRLKKGKHPFVQSKIDRMIEELKNDLGMLILLGNERDN